MKTINLKSLEVADHFEYQQAQLFQKSYKNGIEIFSKKAKNFASAPSAPRKFQKKFGPPWQKKQFFLKKHFLHFFISHSMRNEYQIETHKSIVFLCVIYYFLSINQYLLNCIYHFLLSLLKKMFSLIHIFYLVLILFLFVIQLHPSLYNHEITVKLY